MVEGLQMSKDQFTNMTNKDKLDVLFDNQLQTIDLIKGYKFYQKITAFIGTIIIGGLGIIFNYLFL